MMPNLSRLKFLNRALTENVKSVLFNHATPQISAVRHCAIRRAMLYVPANDNKKINMSLTVKVDSIVLDFYNLFPDDKENARNIVHNLLNISNVTKLDPEWCVKVSPIQYYNSFKAEMTAILTAKSIPATIELSWVDNVKLLDVFTDCLVGLIKEREDSLSEPIPVLLAISCPKAVILMTQLCEKLEELAKCCPIIPSGLIFDYETYVKTAGLTKTTRGLEALYVREKTVTIAKAFGLQAIDMMNTDQVDVKGLVYECRDGVALGFTGKQAKYPIHVPVIQDEFTPARSRIKYAAFIKKQTLEMKNEQDNSDLGTTFMDENQIRVCDYIINVAAFAKKGTVGRQQSNANEREKS